MALSVDPSSVNGYAAQLGRAADDVQGCLSYFRRHVVDLSPANGIISPICYEHAAVKQRLDDMLHHLATLLGASRDELSGAARAYRDTDHATAATLDSTYPQVTRPSSFRYDSYGVR